MEFLLPEIMGILPDLEGDVAGNALFVLKNMLKEMTISKANPTALQLAERLPAFFDSVRLRVQGPAGVSEGRCLS